MSAEITRIMTASQTATRLGIPNIPTKSQAQAMCLIYKEVFLRVKAVIPSATVSSGFRSHKLNVAVKGSKSSQHLYPVNKLGICVAGAIDIDSALDPRKAKPIICKALAEAGILPDQVIIEFPPTGWVHLGFVIDGSKIGKGRNQHLTIGG